MKRTMLYVIALAANISLLLVCLLYRLGAMVEYPAFITMHIIITVVNIIAADKMWQVITLGVTHAITTFFAHLISWHLYSQYLLNSFPIEHDYEGEYVSYYACIIGLVFTLVLFIISLVVFLVQRKSKTNENT